jgi:hypothetical protein
MTFVIKMRGSRMPLIADYECPVHGRFEATVDRDENGDPPATVRCNAKTGTVFKGELFSQPGELFDEVCTELAEHRMSAAKLKFRSFDVIRGGWEKPQNPGWLDTRELGEGQTMDEFHEKRAAIREEQRKRDVMAFAKEHHERPIGGD